MEQNRTVLLPLEVASDSRVSALVQMFIRTGYARSFAVLANSNSEVDLPEVLDEQSPDIVRINADVDGADVASSSTFSTPLIARDLAVVTTGRDMTRIGDTEPSESRYMHVSRTFRYPHENMSTMGDFMLRMNGALTKSFVHNVDFAPQDGVHVVSPPYKEPDFDAVKHLVFSRELADDDEVGPAILSYMRQVAEQIHRGAHIRVVQGDTQLLQKTAIQSVYGRMDNVDSIFTADNSGGGVLSSPIQMLSQAVIWTGGQGLFSTSDHSSTIDSADAPITMHWGFDPARVSNRKHMDRLLHDNLHHTRVFSRSQLLDQVNHLSFAPGDVVPVSNATAKPAENSTGVAAEVERFGIYI